MSEEIKSIHDDNLAETSGMTRRVLLQSSAGVAAAAGAAMSSAQANTSAHPILGDLRARRSVDAMTIRMDAARTHLQDYIAAQETNGDEAYPDYRASFTKTLPHNGLGEVDPGEYRKLLKALGSAKNADFEAITLGGVRKLANPQGAYKFEMAGRDAHNTWMRPAPTFTGAETAAEMAELYWKAICRDVPFTDYGANADIAAAAAELNSFSYKIGPKAGQPLSPSTVFRGETAGDLAGPYISQFLWKPVPFGPTTMEQAYAPSAGGQDFMTDVPNWLNIQRGGAPLESLSKAPARYIANARDLGEYVHNDFSFQAYLNAALILLGTPGSFDLGNLYRTSATQGAFVTLGGPDVLDLVSKAGNLALTGAWYQKWLVHRRLRPEVYGGRLHHQLTGAKDYGLPAEIGASDAVGRVKSAYGTYLLPMAFTEGSPTHPSYPAGHATIAGACCTVLKAFFNEDAPMPGPVVANANGSSLDPYMGSLTIGGEINKLANNIALGRDWAGVHYRSDGVDGLDVGEQQAITLLRDYSRTYNEMFDGFTLTKFKGERIRIQGGSVYPA